MNFNLVRDRKGISKTASLSIIAGLIISTLTVGIIYFPDFFQHKNDEEAGSSRIVSARADYEVTYLSDALEDLEKLGCVIVNVTEVSGYGAGMGFLLEYKEFRKVAYKQKIVFLMYDYSYEDIPFLVTSFENFMVVWTPKELVPHEEYTKFEKVEIQSAVCRKLGTSPNEYWNVTLKLKNTGTATATLIGVFINNVEVNDYNATAAVDGQAVTSMLTTETISSGDTKQINVLIDYDNYETLSSGTTVNIKIHSAGGMDYIKLIELV